MLVTRENICGIKEEILISRLILFFFFPAASIRTRDFSSVLSTNSTFPPLSCKYGRATFVSSHLNESHSSTNANSPMPLFRCTISLEYVILTRQWMQLVCISRVVYSLILKKYKYNISLHKIWTVKWMQIIIESWIRFSCHSSRKELRFFNRVCPLSNCIRTFVTSFFARDQSRSRNPFEPSRAPGMR